MSADDGGGSKLRPDTTKVIVCEGVRDKAFLEWLIKVEKIANGFECVVPNEKSEGDDGGWDRIRKHTIGLATSADWDRIKSLCLVGDSNSKRGARTTSAIETITRAGFSVSGAYKVEGADKKAAIYLMPSPDEDGCLEHLLINAVNDQNPALVDCATSFADCVDRALGVKVERSSNNRAKMIVQCIISAVCKNPMTIARYVWNEEDNPIPKKSARFQRLAEILKAL